MRREKQIKEWKRGWKINLIERGNPYRIGLYSTLSPNPPAMWRIVRTRREDNEAVSFSITQSAESHLRAAGAGAGLRTDAGRFGERRTASTGIPGCQSCRAGSGPRRRRRDADGIAGDPRYLGDKTGRLWPASAAGRAQALQWLFFLSQHVMPAAGEVALRIRSRVTGVPADETVIARGEQALPPVLSILEGQLAKNKWLLGSEFSLVDCAYCPILNVIEKAGFSFADFPKVQTYLDTCRARPTWKETPKLPML